jgi:uncharacterized protein (TIGR00297 family)
MIVAALLAGGVAAAAYWRRALTLEGAVAATVVGTVTFGRGGKRSAAMLLAFFVSSSMLSRLRERQEQTGLAQEKGARRDAWQVLANGGAATAFLLLRSRGGFAGGIAAAGADTWATEIGLLARARPRLITTWRRVEPGTSGGVTVPGLWGSLGGAAVVGLASGSRRGLWLAVFTGVFGSLLDSVLGATVQALYRCRVCGALSESEKHCGLAGVRVRGCEGVNNDVVNGVSTTASAALGAWIGL